MEKIKQFARFFFTLFSSNDYLGLLSWGGGWKLFKISQMADWIAYWQNLEKQK